MQDQAGGTAASRSAFRWSWPIWTIGAALMAVILFGCTFAIWDLRSEAIRQQRVAVRSLSVVLAEQTTRYVQVVDLGLQELQSRVAALGIRSPDELAKSFGNAATRDFLRERLHNLPQANAYTLLKADGHSLVTTRPNVPADLDYSDRDYYRYFIDQKSEGPYISGPLISRVAGTPTMYLSRSIDGPNHILLGLAVAAIDLDYVTNFYRAIELPPGLTVTLLRTDGLVLARYPDVTHDVGKRMTTKSPWYRIATNHGGTYLAPGYLGPGPVVVAVLPLPIWPLVINVSMLEQVALQEWREQAMMIALGGSTASFGFAVLFAIIGQQFRRKASQNVQLGAVAEALRASEARVLDFAQMSADWFWELDDGLRFSWVSDNPMIHAMGIPQRMGMTPWDALGASLDDPHWQKLRDDLSSHQPFRDFRDDEIDHSGQHHSVSINGNPVFDASGRFVGYRGTGRDITADVEAARELEMAKDHAEAASRIKSEFLANMSHELRTPLNAIIGFSELIHDQPSDKIGDTYVEYATEINTAGHHLLDMINDVLDLSKIEAGRYELANETVDLGRVVRSCIGMLRPRANEGGVRIDNRIKGVIVALRADTRAIKQVVLNLLSNAIKFTSNGGVVSVDVERSDIGIALIIADTGIGIDPAALQSLFQPFKQADASISRRFGGSGLGLAICQKLLALHSATLTLDSAPGSGTTARVVFPLKRIVEAVRAPSIGLPALSA